MEACGPVRRLALLAVLLLASCRGADPPGEVSTVSREPPLVVASWDEVQQMVAAHEGKVVVLDLWSTWCIPCKKEFPHLVEIHEGFPADVACISVSLNQRAMRQLAQAVLGCRGRATDKFLHGCPGNGSHAL